MLPAHTRNLRQIATYWPPGSPDGFGRVLFDKDPVRIKCRWQDVAVLFRDANGDEVTSSAVVYADRVLENGGKLALGDYSCDGTEPISAAKEIRQTAASPNLRASKQLNKVYL